MATINRGLLSQITFGTERDRPMTFEARELSPDRSVRDLFGAELRRHRELAGMSLRRLSDVVNYSKSQLARIEAAESLPYDDLPTKLDVCFGTGELFVRLHALAKREPFPRKYRRVIGEIETRATVIEEYASSTVPGLLQTRKLAEESLRFGTRTPRMPRWRAWYRPGWTDRPCWTGRSHRGAGSSSTRRCCDARSVNPR
ncbi:helix-turn-helix domain-containing protein [Streptomyces decoyicus]|uniref:helix-turn-helix domain-containing protein n=1 Tax=Streptomyces decoyicus TaxID=249567 RepID=UPI00345DFEC7